MVQRTKLEQLQYAFPKLTEFNQQFVLGLTEGLKHAQNKPEKPSDARLPPLKENGKPE